MADAKRRTPRKRKAESDVRSTTVQTRWSEAELGQLDRVCGRLNQGRSSVIRRAVDALDASADGRRETVSGSGDAALVNALARVRGELNRIGVNVNQLARRANAGDHVDSADLIGIELGLEEIREVLHQRLGPTGQTL